MVFALSHLSSLRWDKKLWNISLVPIQWAKSHDATKMPQLLCVKLEDPKKFTSQALRRSRAVINLSKAACTTYVKENGVNCPVVGKIGRPHLSGRVGWVIWVPTWSHLSIWEKNKITEKPHGLAGLLIQQFDIVREFFLKSVGNCLRYGRFCDVTTRHFWSKIGQTSWVCGRRSF